MRGSIAGLSDVVWEGESKAYRRFLAVLDCSFSCFVVAPAVVGYWRGTWGLADTYLFPESPLKSYYASIAIGLIGHLTLMFTQNIVKRTLHPDKHRLTYYFWSRTYTYVFGIVSVNYWRGPWELLEVYAGHGGSAASICVSVVALAVLRCLRNITAPPFALVTDNPKEYFDVPTMFRLSSSREPFLFMLDCIFSVVVVGSLVVFVWRGAWDLLDYFLYPGDAVWSAWSSAALGYGLAVLTFLLQPLARRACSNLQAARRLLIADIFLFLSFVATINVWRSVWNLLDIYFIPENPVLSNWITHAGCIIFLMLLNCANSVMVRGVYIDAEEEGGQCVVFPCYYLRVFFQKERAKKRKRRLEKAAAAALKGDDTPLVTKIHAGNHIMVPIPEKEPFEPKNSEKD